ncbi:hypothetical protein EVAR_80184_1 [Eumeta japonica]|uniref:Uncharacterized protein n=1 Tax=Eumeta variegata TaxID=151549 RepID=A0A4C1UB64_EUMVA|nr:hypothetical protein EVAR_80184_1 [Eumeta japonica]
MQRSGSTLPDPSAFSRTCLLYGIATLSWLTSQRQSFVRRTVASIQNKETLSTKTRRRDLDAARWRRCVRPPSLFYPHASADRVEERSLVPRSRSHARLRRNAIMSHAFSCVQPAFIDL